MGFIIIVVESFLTPAILLLTMKLSEFQHYLHQKHIPLAILTYEDKNLTYFTQMKPSYAFLLITPKKAMLYLTKLDKSPRIPGITVKPLSKNWHKNLKAVQKIGINKDSITVAALERLKKKFPKARFVDIFAKLGELREEKTVEEIGKMQKACDLTSDAFTALLKEFPKKTLYTEQDVALFLEKHIRQHDGGIAFPTIAARGEHAATPHHVPSLSPLKRGFLVLDFGASYQHYCADMTRTIFLGTPTKKEKELYHLLLAAQQAAIDKVAQGVAFSELDKIARKKLGSCSRYFTHSLGHGIGIGVHEGTPYQDKKGKIKEKQVFTIEPGIYIPGKVGLRIEDTLLFDGKVKILTKATKELISIPWKD